MQPIKVDENMVNDLIDARVIEYAAPPGEESNVDGVQGIFELGVPGRFGPDRIYLPWRPGPDEIAALVAGEPLWLVVIGHRMPVVQLYVQPLPGAQGVRLLDGPHDGKFLPREECREETGLRQAIDFDDGSVYALFGDGYVFVSDPEAAAKEREIDVLVNGEESAATRDAERAERLGGTDSGPSDG